MDSAPKTLPDATASSAAAGARPDFGGALVGRVRPRQRLGRRPVERATGDVVRRSLAFANEVGVSAIGRWSLGRARGQDVEQLAVRPPIDYWPWAADETDDEVARDAPAMGFTPASGSGRLVTQAARATAARIARRSTAASAVRRAAARRSATAVQRAPATGERGTASNSITAPPSGSTGPPDPSRRGRGPAPSWGTGKLDDLARMLGVGPPVPEDATAPAARVDPVRSAATVARPAARAPNRPVRRGLPIASARRGATVAGAATSPGAIASGLRAELDAAAPAPAPTAGTRPKQGGPRDGSAPPSGTTTSPRRANAPATGSPTAAPIARSSGGFASRAAAATPTAPAISPRPASPSSSASLSSGRTRSPVGEGPELEELPPDLLALRGRLEASGLVAPRPDTQGSHPSPPPHVGPWQRAVDDVARGATHPPAAPSARHVAEIAADPSVPVRPPAPGAWREHGSQWRWRLDPDRRAGPRSVRPPSARLSIDDAAAPPAAGDHPTREPLGTPASPPTSPRADGQPGSLAGPPPRDGPTSHGSPPPSWAAPVADQAGAVRRSTSTSPRPEVTRSGPEAGSPFAGRSPAVEPTRRRADANPALDPAMPPSPGPATLRGVADLALHRRPVTGRPTTTVEHPEELSVLRRLPTALGRFDTGRAAGTVTHAGSDTPVSAGAPVRPVGADVPRSAAAPHESTVVDRAAGGVARPDELRGPRRAPSALDTGTIAATADPRTSVAAEAPVRPGATAALGSDPAGRRDTLVVDRPTGRVDRRAARVVLRRLPTALGAPDVAPFGSPAAPSSAGAWARPGIPDGRGPIVVDRHPSAGRPHVVDARTAGTIRRATVVADRPARRGAITSSPASGAGPHAPPTITVPTRPAGPAAVGAVARSLTSSGLGAARSLLPSILATSAATAVDAVLAATLAPTGAVAPALRTTARDLPSTDHRDAATSAGPARRASTTGPASVGSDVVRRHLPAEIEPAPIPGPARAERHVAPTGVGRGRRDGAVGPPFVGEPSPTVGPAAAAPHRPAPSTPTPAETFATELARHRTERPRAIPMTYRPLATAIVGDRAVHVSTSVASRRALAKVGKVAATTGDTIHLASPSTRADVIAHELTHVAHPSPVARFFDDDDHSPEEHRAEQVAAIMRRAPVLPRTSAAASRRPTVAPAGDMVRRRTTAVGTPATPAGTISAAALAERITADAASGVQRVIAGGHRMAPPTNGGARSAPTGATNPTGPAQPSPAVQQPATAASPDLGTQFEHILELLEDRILRELERRGGRFRGGF